jgi:hypothetical protein
MDSFLFGAGGVLVAFTLSRINCAEKRTGKCQRHFPAFPLRPKRPSAHLSSSTRGRPVGCWYAADFTISRPAVLTAAEVTTTAVWGRMTALPPLCHKAFGGWGATCGLVPWRFPIHGQIVNARSLHGETPEVKLL